MPLKKYKHPLSFAIALACAVGALLLTRYYFDTRERELRAKLQSENTLVDVVVAKMDLPAGARVDLDTMMIKSIPAEYVPDGVVIPTAYPEVENRYLSVPISQEKPLMRSMVEGVSRIEKFSDLLAEGERAITLEVDGVSSTEHMLEAGDYIDLGVVKNKGDAFELLLERARVLSTGNFSVADAKAPGMYKNAQYATVTLGVAGEHIKRIYEAQQNHQLVFLLRNEKDRVAAAYDTRSRDAESVTVYAGRGDGGVVAEHRDVSTPTSVISSSNTYPRNARGRLMRVLSPDEVQGGGAAKDDGIPDKNRRQRD